MNMRAKKLKYFVEIKRIKTIAEYYTLDSAFELIKSCMPCEATIKATEE